MKLQLHFQQATKEDRGEESRAEETDKLKEALSTLSSSIDQTVDAVANFARDEAVREDVRDAGRTLVQALESTFSEVVGRIRNPK
jgi:hypothetical protein